MSSKFWIAINPHFQGKLAPGKDSAHLWRKYNDSFTSMHLDDAALAEQIALGYSYTAIHQRVRHLLGTTKAGYKRWSSFRRVENFVSAQHIGLDFDGESPANAPDALIADEFIETFASIIHTTASSTPDAPRSRVVFVMEEPIKDATLYGEYASALIWRYTGMADSSCKDPVRVFFGAPGCQQIVIGNRLPQVVIEGIHKEFMDHIASERKVVRATGRALEGVEDEVAVVRSALQAIPAWGDYYDWLRVCMAVHNAFPNDQGIALIEEWSPGFPGEVERKFASFSAEGNGSGAVSIGTLYYYATLNGWDKREVVARSVAGNMRPGEDIF